MDYAVAVADCVMDGCRERLSKALPGFRPDMLLIAATHTHTAPDQPRPFTDFERPKMGDDVVTKEAYAELLIEEISKAAVEAWNRRVPSGLSWGRGYAVIGFNQRITYVDGSTRMYSKGFIDQQRQEDWEKRYGVTLYTYKRKNQHEQNPPVIQQLLSENRRQIETTFSSLDRVEGLEDHGAKTVLGLVTRTIAKIAAYTFRRYLLRFHGLDVLSFQTVNIS